VTSLGCPHTSRKETDIISLGIPIKHKRTLEESLASFLQDEILDGDNSYFCTSCDKKVPAVKKGFYKKLPRNLIFVLKRFEFDLDKM
jgi:ubiquitin carboxyl-terminal hydrolase 34